MRLKSTCKPRKGLGLFASLFASQLSFQLSTLSSLTATGSMQAQAEPATFSTTLSDMQACMTNQFCFNRMSHIYHPKVDLQPESRSVDDKIAAQANMPVERNCWDFKMSGSCIARVYYCFHTGRLQQIATKICIWKTTK